jgi:nucleoside-diphosphate-sugar epimerase
MAKFLVTGGAGFIGGHITETLIKNGHKVRVLDNFTSGKIENLLQVRARIDLVRGDIRSLNTCLKASKGIDYVLHQAALRSVPKSLKDPHEYIEVNENGTLNMLEAALINKVKSFVLASSSSVYGDTDIFPEKETFLPQPISPYALTKLAGEHYCKMYSLHYKLPTVALRYFNVFGPRQSLDDEYAVVVPKFVTCMLNNEPPPIFGTGRQSRDFTYVSNVVEANFLASQKASIKAEVFNVASGRDYSVLELVKMLNSIMGKKIKPRFLPKRAGDVFRTWADISRIKRCLYFKPGVSFLDGLRLTVEYFEKANKNA